MRQLKRDGTLGTPETFGFVDSDTLIKRLKRDGYNMVLMVGLTFRNPVTKDRLMDNIEAIRWVMEAKDHYVYEAYYEDGDENLHVAALSGNDLF